MQRRPGRPALRRASARSEGRKVVDQRSEGLSRTESLCEGLLGSASMVVFIFEMALNVPTLTKRRLKGVGYLPTSWLLVG